MRNRQNAVLYDEARMRDPIEIPSLDASQTGPSNSHSARIRWPVGFGADRNESVSSISGGDRGCAKALGAPPIATYVTLVFLRSLSHVIEICAVLPVIWGGVISQKLG
jgi:hypothetical protein